jgi:two-component system, OmpR family, phosphate regulon response regulator PhoB
MANKLILVVEDEAAIRELIAYGLKRAGYQVAEAADCRRARIEIANKRPDLVLLDWMLPDMSGIELARELKRGPETRDLPIIMVTARGAEGDKVAGLDGGADDYLTKPFSPRELAARIQAVLRRSAPTAVGDRLSCAGLELDTVGHRVSAAGGDISLGPTEYRLLEFFMRNPERVFSRTQLLDRVWGGDVYVEERTIDVHIRRLRQALEVQQLDHLVQTVRGSGYRLSARPP